MLKCEVVFPWNGDVQCTTGAVSSMYNIQELGEGHGADGIDS